MASQTILFTVMPRGISVDTETLPVSVYVSPRLFADPDPANPARPSVETDLASFTDWLFWTRNLKEQGLSLTLTCAGATLTAAVPTEILEPPLWEALFKPETLVRSHTFDDYTNHSVISSSTRSALSLLKGLYQKASVELALPESRQRSRQGEANLYARLQDLVDGLAVNWNEERSYRNRYEYQSSAQALARDLRQQVLGQDGLAPVASLNADQRTTIAQAHLAGQKIPPGQPLADNPTDFAKLLDFHQALSSLNSYPELLRALGLVIDLELPKDFVAIAAPGQLSVTEATAAWSWALPPTILPHETAYLYLKGAGDGFSFLTAPRAFQPPPANDAGPRLPLETLGLLALRPSIQTDPPQFGLSQVDVDGGMHKLIMTAETVQRDRPDRPGPAASPHPEVFDPRIALPSLRSGGFSLFADERGAKLVQKLKDSNAFNTQLNAPSSQPNPNPQPALFYAEDLVHGYRIDIWDSHTDQWHSLHRRHGVYSLEGLPFDTTDTEGFTQLAAVQPAPNPAQPPPKDIYLQETIARWSGWSLSVPFPDNVLSSDPDPAKVLDEPKSRQNVPATPFKMTTDFTIVGGSLPSLRFGRRYRLRARVVDICGNSLNLDHALLPQLSALFALPADPAGAAYVRYEPVIAPQVVLRDAQGVTEPGSQVDRLVIRTFNTDVSKDGDAANLTASDRHILPPRTSVEMAERLGMLDDETGKLSRSAALYDLLFAKDGAELPTVTVAVAGSDAQEFPLVAGDRIDTLPYIPDVLSRGAALRDLPGTPPHSLSTVQPGPEADAPVPYSTLEDVNPRPGSATLISFDGATDWQTMQPFRLALADGTAAPRWDAQNRVLTVSLPKGTSAIVPLTSYLQPDDLKLMGIWQWLREQIEAITQNPNLSQVPPEAIAHILQRTAEGGHWMLTPPRLLHLVHAVQQPIGTPTFTALSVQHEPYDELNPDRTVLQTAPESAFKPVVDFNTDDLNPVELNAMTVWRILGATDAYLLGGLQVHAASTSKVDILADWDDPVDDLSQPGPGSIRQAAPVDQVPIDQLNDHRITVNPGSRGVGYYVDEQDLLCFVKRGDALGNLKSGAFMSDTYAPRHQINDTKHHRIRYTAVATSRYRDYFKQTDDAGKVLDASHFSRPSQSVLVDVPASARPVAPQMAYVIPTFGWQRQTETNLKRSVRFGGGLRVYLERPWFSSGEGELLGVTLYNGLSSEMIDPDGRDRWKSYITQWGNDPIWQTPGLSGQTPSAFKFPDAIAQEDSLRLEEDASKRVSVVGHAVAFDAERQQWYCDLTIDAGATYSPFVRLALVRYQPHALLDAKLSRVVLADFVQLTPERSATLTADPYHIGQLRITVSGPVPTQPARANTILLQLQERDDTLEGDLAWRDAPTAGTFLPTPNDPTSALPQGVLYTGTLQLNVELQLNRYRLLISEYESFPADGNAILAPRGGRLIYAETILLDEVLLAGPAIADNRTAL